MTALAIDPVPHLQTSVTVAEGVPTTLRPEGELDQWTVGSAGWSAAVAEACADTATGGVILLDLRRLYFMDLDGLACLNELARMLAADRRRLLIIGARPRIREFLRDNSSLSLAGERLSFEEAFAQAAAGSRHLRPEATAPAAALAVAA